MIHYESFEMPLNRLRGVTNLCLDPYYFIRKNLKRQWISTLLSKYLAYRKPLRLLKCGDNSSVMDTLNFLVWLRLHKYASQIIWLKRKNALGQFLTMNLRLY